MKKLSENAGLSHNYTNHCIRSTCISELDNSGFEAHHITAVSGHKSETTIKNYSVKCPASKKREMSDALSAKILGMNITPPPPPKKIKLSSTVSRAQNQQKFDTLDLNILDWIPIENNADDFDLGDIITQVDNMERQKTTTVDLVAKETVHPNEPLSELPLPNPNVHQNQNLVQNITNNQANMNQFPFSPKMIFPHSNVTINYNFNSK